MTVWRRFSRLCSHCVAVRKFSILAVTFCGRRKAQGKPSVLVAQSRLFVVGAGDWSGSISMCRYRGRRSALDMAVARSDFVAGAFGHVAHFQKPGEVSSESCVLVS